MSSKYKRHKNRTNVYTYNRKEKRSSLFLLLPISFILIVIPLLVRQKQYNTHLSGYSWFSSVDVVSDFFLLVKFKWYIIAIVVIGLILLGKLLSNRKQFDFPRIFIPVAVYILLAMLSSLFGGNIGTSIRGGYDLLQPIWVVLGYGITLYYCYIVIDSEADIEFLIKSFFVGFFILGIIGVFQFFKMDFFRTDVASELISGQKNALSINFPLGRVYTTLFNPNYVGVYTAIIIPILTTLLILWKGMWNKIICAVLDGIAIVCAIGSQSLAGMIGLLVAVAAILVLLRRFILKYYYITIPLVSLMVVIFLLINQWNDYIVTNRLKNILNIKPTTYSVEAINTREDCVELVYNGNPLYFRMYENANISCQDANYKELELVWDSETMEYKFLDESLSRIVITPVSYENTLYLLLKIDGSEWYFTNQTEDNTYCYLNKFGKLDKIITAENKFFQGYENFASSRMYIWTRTLPLLKKNIILGGGQDTYTIQFPQQDHLNLDRLLGGNILTKPHCLYLQIAIESGVLSLIAYLVFYLMYFIQSVKLFIKGDFNSFYAVVGVSIFIGSIAYMVTSLSNDSNIAVTPVIWILIGIGITANLKEKKRRYL